MAKSNEPPHSECDTQSLPARQTGSAVFIKDGYSIGNCSGLATVQRTRLTVCRVNQVDKSPANVYIFFIVDWTARVADGELVYKPQDM